MGTLQQMVSNARGNRRVEEINIEFNDGKKEKKVKKKKAPAMQPRVRTTFDEKGWNEAYKQACDDLTPEELEACQYVASNLLTPEEFAAL